MIEFGSTSGFSSYSQVAQSNSCPSLSATLASSSPFVHPNFLRFPSSLWRQVLMDRHERDAVPDGNVSGARNRGHLTGLSEWKWIRQAKAVITLVFRTRT